MDGLMGRGFPVTDQFIKLQSFSKGMAPKINNQIW